MSREEKLDILRRVDKVAREADKRVQEVTASLSGVYELILVAATDGTLAADVRPLVRLSVSVLVEEDGKRERGASGGGGRFGYEFFLADLDGEAADAGIAQAVMQQLEKALKQLAQGSGSSQALTQVRRWDSASQKLPDANLALISVAEVSLAADQCQ